MMQASRTNFDDAPLVVSTVDVGHLLDDAVKSTELGAADCGIEVTLRLDSPASDLLIDGDANRLEQVFVNLLSNALKFTPRGGKVTVVARRAYTEGDCVEVKVADTGIGIPPEEFPNVFKRFFRASTATQATIPGFGIGLSLVQSIVQEHHGTITFDSTVGKGTVFTVTLPTRYISTKPSDVTI
jgi:signal transduction histidine kinase